MINNIRGLNFIWMIFFVLAIACTGNDKKGQNEIVVTTEYYDDGKISKEIEMIDSIPNGKYISYYPSGKIQNESFYQNGLLEGISKTFSPKGRLVNVFIYRKGRRNGECIFFYDNGYPFTKGVYDGELKTGKHYQFYENDSGKVEYEIDYAIVRGEEYVNGYRKFDVSGELLEVTPYLEFEEKSDSLKILLRENEFDRMRVVLGDFDIYFYLNDSLSLDTLETRSFSVKLLPEEDTIRGYVENYKIESEKGSIITTLSKDLYFQYVVKR